ncbi:hypothetical protein [Ectobacillus ponti]|uniref:Uncharacterized protein n=1 Tax=Ectobacillus ponti TaxID=2961894 RepID=A0AA41X6A8_9BACI|nr:hypothetical protein [Ectobacillus ponti]MCP8969741.1 hypothetical protein [Ectobacillus ponti]
MSQFLETVTQLLLMCGSAAYNIIIELLGMGIESIKAYAAATTYETTLIKLQQFAKQYPDAAHMISGAFVLNLAWKFLTRRARAIQNGARRKVNSVKRGVTRIGDSAPSLPQAAGHTPRLPVQRYDVIDAEYEEYDDEDYED